jgi:hypothetical protein
VRKLRIIIIIIINGTATGDRSSDTGVGAEDVLGTLVLFVVYLTSLSVSVYISRKTGR